MFLDIEIVIVILNSITSHDYETTDEDEDYETMKSGGKKKIKMYGVIRMIGIGTLVNAGTVIVGSLIGLAAGGKFPARAHRTLTQVAALITIGVGLQMFIAMRHVLVVMPSLIVGALLGEWWDLEGKMERFGIWLKRATKAQSDTFLDGFVTTSLLYCVGPMAILGSLADGFAGDHTILFTKALLDGTVSIGFAAALGVGVLFSAGPVLIYQGALTLAGFFFGHFITDNMLSELTATGGLLIVGLGLNVLEIFPRDRRIPIGNLLPALFIAALIAWCQAQ